VSRQDAPAHPKNLTERVVRSEALRELRRRGCVALLSPPLIKLEFQRIRSTPDIPDAIESPWPFGLAGSRKCPVDRKALFCHAIILGNGCHPDETIRLLSRRKCLRAFPARLCPRGEWLSSREKAMCGWWKSPRCLSKLRYGYQLRSGPLRILKRHS
jgi:hypothetical protein